ncbi:MAG: DUF4189 domain-containing protein [Mycobacterium sp.]|uniref:DUF4189 domain-containing protein n=1 Tax=Mycobacterium sp. TaxID=1785 RepID=UPI001ECACE34|nr:DUF4189 domain-containing protein [Mycobacterium sp.]MBW0015995.1 DUF4189 domain-containing protein [Mycobacterium sp.]
MKKTMMMMLAALPVAGVLAIPVAHADDSWIALAYSPSKGTTTIVSGRPSQADAESDAVSHCNSHAGVTDCVMAASSTNCVSIATDPNPSNNAVYAGGHGSTLAAADADAMSHARSGWTIESHKCNS